MNLILPMLVALSPLFAGVLLVMEDDLSISTNKIVAATLLAGWVLY